MKSLKEVSAIFLILEYEKVQKKKVQKKKEEEEEEESKKKTMEYKIKW